MITSKERRYSELSSRGLNEIEVNQFIELLDKIKLTQEDIDAFYYEMEQGIPFEGGMAFTEALTALKEAYKWQ